jgi:hypothetical protein
LAMSEQRPDFLFVCDHGIRGGELGRIALLRWFPDRPGWWAAEGVDESAIGIWPMEGNQRGHDPKWLRSEWTAPDEPDLRRDAIEIKCRGDRCGRRAYRSDEDKLQSLLTKIATDEKFRTVFTVSADDSLIVISLDALHLARNTAKKQYGLPV